MWKYPIILQKRKNSEKRLQDFSLEKEQGKKRFRERNNNAR